MDAVKWDDVIVLKSDQAGNVRGGKLTPDQLRGPVGEKIRAAIEAKPGEDQHLEVDGMWYAVFTRPNPVN